jgi:hypothetical protein
VYVFVCVCYLFCLFDWVFLGGGGSDVLIWMIFLKLCLLYFATGIFVLINWYENDKVSIESNLNAPGKESVNS